MSIDNSIKWPQYMGAFAASGGALSAGTIFGWVNTIIFHQKIHEIKEYDFDITMNDYFWIISTTILSAALGSIPTGILINNIGRKWPMILLTIPITIGWLLVIFAQNLEMLLCGHFFLGIAGGAFCIITPIYISEIAQKEIRGFLVTYYQFMVTLGVLLVYSLGFFVDIIFVSIISGLIPIIFGASLYFFPETPLYLVTNGCPEDAKKSVQWYRGKHYDFNSEVALLQSEDQDVKANPTSLLAAFGRRESLKSFYIAFGLIFFQQMSGIYALIHYSDYIFKDWSIDIHGDISAIIIALIQVIATLCSGFLVDKIGRRKLLLFSEVIMTICTFLLSGYVFLIKHLSDFPELRWLPITLLCCFIVVFSIGIGPIPWIVISEIFAPDIKGLGISLVATFNWIFTFIVIFVFHSLTPFLSLIETFCIFSVISFIGIFFIYFVVPETKGKSLIIIQKELSNQL